MISNAITSRRNFLKIAGIASSTTVLSTLLAGCTSEPRSETQAASSSSSSAAVSSSSTSASAPASNEAIQPAAISAGNVLIAVFSWSGNTLAMAERINDDIAGSTLFRIEPATPYPTDYNTVVDLAQEEIQNNVNVPMAADVPGFDSYDTIFIGYPLWWYRVPQVIKSFMDAHDFTGKTVIPFDTHGGGGWSQSLSDIEAGCAGATILDGLALSGSSIQSHLTEVDEWVASLPLA